MTLVPRRVPRRLLVVEKHFVHGFGGTPESVLLLANHLRRIGIVVDVLSDEGVYREVGALEGLPTTGAGFEEQGVPPLSEYGAVLIAGSWNRSAIPVAMRARRAGVPVSYAAKGNLCAIEFTRPRDLKKVIYLAVLEVIPLILSRTVIFSSSLERTHSLLPTFLVRRRQVLLPEPFKVPSIPGVSAAPTARRDPASFTLGFLAEISPRKGLMELVRGFLRWCEQQVHEAGPTLRVAGDPRPGSERYLAAVKRYAREHRFGDLVVWEEGKRGDARTAFYRQVDVFVCPSRFESFGLTPLEALWEGTPVLCGPRIGFLEYLQPGPGLRILPDLSTSAIAVGLEQSRSNLDEAKADAAASRPRITNAFAGENLVSQFAQVLFGDRQGTVSSD